MSRRHLGPLRAIAIAVILAPVVALIPSASWAQAVAPAGDIGATAGWYVTPSTSLTEEWDDNVFRRPSQREADFITRVTSGWTGGYRSRPFTLLGSFAVDSEIYAEHPQLDGPAKGTRVGVQTTYLPARNLTLGLSSGYTETETPSDLNTLTNVETGRAKTTQISASPTMAYRLTPLTTGNASYSYTTTSAEGGVTTVGHAGQLSLTRQLTPVDTGTVAYGVTVTESTESSATAPAGSSPTVTASAGSSTIVSHVLTLGWTRRLTELTTLSLHAGPRLTEGTISPEVNAEISHRWQAVRLALSYFRTETTLVGQAGTVKTQGMTGSLGWTPLRRMTVAISPSWAQTEPSQTTQSQTTQSQTTQSSASQITVYMADVSLSYQFTKWLTASAAYRLLLQQQQPKGMEDTTVSLRFDIVYPVRVH